MSKEYMQAFREARKAMGFRHTSAYIPTNRLADFSLYVERLKAERMVEICELDPTSRERVELAKRNLVDVPSTDEVNKLMEHYENQPAIIKQAKECIAALDKSNSCMNVGKLSDTDEEFVKWTSLGIAHNTLANVLWRELAHAVHQLEVQKTN